MGTLIEFARFGQPPDANCQEPDARPPVLLRFPIPAVDTFILEMRRALACFAASNLSLCVSEFGVDESGAEVCRFANGLVIGRDHGRGLFVTDTRSGFTDSGPFASIHEICQVIVCLET